MKAQTLSITPQICNAGDEEMNLWESEYSVIEENKLIKSGKGIGIEIGESECVLSMSQAINLYLFLKSAISKQTPVELFENTSAN